MLKGSNMIRNSSQLYETHVQAWSELWKRGRIDIEGDVATAKAVYSSFFYITSSLPLKQDKNFPFYGLSPSGLAFGYDSVGVQTVIYIICSFVKVFCFG